MKRCGTVVFRREDGAGATRLSGYLDEGIATAWVTRSKRRMIASK